MMAFRTYFDQREGIKNMKIVWLAKIMMNDYPGYWQGRRNANLIKSLQFTMEYQGFEIIGFSHQKFETVKWCFRALGI